MSVFILAFTVSVHDEFKNINKSTELASSAPKTSMNSTTKLLKCKEVYSANFFFIVVYISGNHLWNQDTFTFSNILIFITSAISMKQYIALPVALSPLRMNEINNLMPWSNYQINIFAFFILK